MSRADALTAPYGAVIALALDLELRERFNGQSLDAYMRLLWKTYGAQEKPYRPNDLVAALATLTRDEAFARDFFRTSVDGSGLPDMAKLLMQAGLVLRPTNPTKAWLGVGELVAGGAALTLAQTPAEGTPLYAAGIDRGDRVVALGRTAITSAADWTSVIGRVKPGERVAIRYVQRGRDRTAEMVAVADAALEIVRVETTGKAMSARQRAFRSAWLGAE